MNADAAAWFVFGGVVFCLMGARLLGDAEGNARGVRAHLPAADLRSLIRAYRAAGAAFAAVGLTALLGVWLFPEALERALPHHRADGLARKAAGLLALLAGLGLLVQRASEWARPKAVLPESLRRELGLEPDAPAPGARLAEWCGWGLALAFAAFGCWLLTRKGSP